MSYNASTGFFAASGVTVKWSLVSWVAGVRTLHASGRNLTAGVGEIGTSGWYTFNTASIPNGFIGDAIFHSGADIAALADLTAANTLAAVSLRPSEGTADDGVRYVNTLTGSDSNDGLTRRTAWLSVTKLNAELAAATEAWSEVRIAAGPVNPLRLTAQLLIPALHRGIKVAGPVEGVPGFLRFRKSLGSVWGRHNSGTYPNVWNVADAQTGAVVYEDGKTLTKITAANIAAAAPLLQATPGSFYVDGVSASYMHPLGSTNPNTDGKVYERSYSFGPGDGSHAVRVLAPDFTLEDLHITGGLTTPGTVAQGEYSDAYALYCEPTGVCTVRRVFATGGTKHTVGFNNGTSGYNLTVEDSWAEQATPYVAAGAQTAWVVYADETTISRASLRFVRCGTKANVALAGSTAGTIDTGHLSFYCHGTGTPAQAWTRVELDNCQFSGQTIAGGLPAGNGIRITGGVIGAVSSDHFVIRDARVDAQMPATDSATGKGVVTGCILVPKLGPANGESARGWGTLIYDENIADSSLLATSFYFALFVRLGAFNLTWTRNRFIAKPTSDGAVIGFGFLPTDRLTFDGNSYQPRATDGLIMRDFNNAVNHTVASWRAAGYETAPQTGDAYARIGAAGAGLTAISSLSAQGVRDAMKLAPTAGAADEGSLDDLIQNVSGGGSGVGDILVDHDTGGADNLRYVDDEGDGVEADVTAYLTSEYGAGATPRGQVRTGSDGRWLTQMMLFAGDYTFVFDAANRPLATVEQEVA